MADGIAQFINAAQLYVLATYLIVLICSSKNKLQHQILILICTISIITEVWSTILLYLGKPFGILFSISVLIHHSLWLVLLMVTSGRSALIMPGIVGYLVFGITNLLFMEGMIAFNYTTFIAGALLYLVFFIIDSFLQIKNENFTFLTSNNYLLLVSPVIFFFGFSFIFGFRGNSMSRIMIMEQLTLYNFIQTTVNLIYYSFINVYIIREYRLKNA